MSAVTGAAPVTGAGEQDQYDPAAVQLAIDFNLSVEEASTRVARQPVFETLASSLADRYTSEYAGAYVDQEMGGGLVVSFRAPVPDILAALPEVDSSIRETVTFVEATYSQQELQQAALRIEGLIVPGKGRVVGVDPRTNTVEVALYGSVESSLASDLPAELMRQTSLVNGEPGITNLACSVSSPFRCDQPVRGGAQIYPSNVSGNAPGPYPAGNCTAGFNVMGNSGTKYVLTAGHCLQSPPSTSWRAAKVNGASFSLGVQHTYYVANSPGGDYGLVRVSNANADGRGIVLVNQFSSPGKTAARNESYQIEGVGTAGSLVGEYLCMSGAKSGTSCGIVTHANSTAPDGMSRQGRVEFAAAGAGGYYGRVCSGDSGGPLYTGHLGYGLVRGGADSDFIGFFYNNVPCFRAVWFSSLKYALEDLNSELVCPTSADVRITDPSC